MPSRKRHIPSRHGVFSCSVSLSEPRDLPRSREIIGCPTSSLARHSLNQICARLRFYCAFLFRCFLLGSYRLLLGHSIFLSIAIHIKHRRAVPHASRKLFTLVIRPSVANEFAHTCAAQVVLRTLLLHVGLDSRAYKFPETVAREGLPL